MGSPSFDETHEYTITELSNQPVIWVVPDEHLEGAYQASLTLPKGHGFTLTLPAEEQEWRDAAHHKAYVRPVQTKEEA